MTGAEMMTIYPGSGTRHEGHADQLVSTSAAAPAALPAPNAAGMVTGPSSIRGVAGRLSPIAAYCRRRGRWCPMRDGQVGRLRDHFSGMVQNVRSATARDNMQAGVYA